MRFLLIGLFFTTFSLASPYNAGEVGRLKSELYNKYGIEALDKTTQQSPTVLKDLLLLLDNAFCPELVRSLGQFRYLYAYDGHDDRFDIAAYHPEAKAISIGGMSTYPEGIKSGDDHRIQILSALAHEIGHDFLMEKLSPQELEQVSKKFGGWAPIFGNHSVQDFYSPLFFSHYPKRVGDFKKDNVTSAYAEKNVHEWFADAFAAFVLHRLGEKNILGANWQEKLVVNPKYPGDYWVNYNNLSPEFIKWLTRVSDSRL